MNRWPERPSGAQVVSVLIALLLLAAALLGPVAGWLAAVAALALLVAAYVDFRSRRAGHQAIESLARSVRELAGGSREVSADESLSGALGTMAADLNRHAADVRARESAATELQRRLRRLTHFYAALENTNRACARAKSPLELFEALCCIVTETGHTAMAWVGAVDGQRMNPVAWSSELAREYTTDLDIFWDPARPQSIGPTASAVLANKPYVASNYDEDPRTHQFRERAARFGIRSAVALPITTKGVVTAVLNIYSDVLDYFDDELVAVALELASDISFALNSLEDQRARAAAEEALTESSRRLRQVFDMLPGYVVAMSADGSTFVDANSYTCALFGLSRAEVAGKTSRELNRGLHPDDAERVFGAVDRNGHVSNFEARLMVGRTEVREALLSVRRIELDGQAANLIVGCDITEKKAAERALAQREHQVMALVESTSEAIVVVDIKQNLVFLNNAAAEMFQVDRNAVLGTPLSRLVPDWARAAHGAHVAKVLSSQASDGAMGMRRTTRGLRANGEEFDIEATIVRTLSDDKVRGIAIIRERPTAAASG